VNIEPPLISFEGWTLRIRPPQIPSGKRILLMLHGWQGDENSMWIFARHFPADCWIVAPRGLYTAPEGGYSWRMPESGGGTMPPSWPSVDMLRASANALVDLLDAWSRANSLDASQVDGVGFSQGAALTFTLGLLHPARMRKMAILSGFAPEGAEQMLAPEHFNGKKVFVAHGLKDETIPIEQARRTVDLFERAGAQVVYCESALGHKLSADCLKALESYLA
jgi:phospholipase/carboxylesterase